MRSRRSLTAKGRYEREGAAPAPGLDQSLAAEAAQLPDQRLRGGPRRSAGLEQLVQEGRPGSVAVRRRRLPGRLCL